MRLLGLAIRKSLKSYQDHFCGALVVEPQLECIEEQMHKQAVEMLKTDFISKTLANKSRNC